VWVGGEGNLYEYAINPLKWGQVLQYSIHLPLIVRLPVAGRRVTRCCSGAGRAIFT
jgi:hypothetical protein